MSWLAIVSRSLSPKPIAPAANTPIGNGGIHVPPENGAVSESEKTMMVRPWATAIGRYRAGRHRRPTTAAAPGANEYECEGADELRKEFGCVPVGHRSLRDEIDG